MKLLSYIVAVALHFIFLFPISSYSAQDQGLIRIGILAYRGVDQAFLMWNPTAEYLSSRVTGHAFSIIPLDFDEINQAVSKGDVDFILANSSIYVELENHFGVNRIATMKKKADFGDVYTTVFGGVIFTRADRKDILSLEDLKGKSFIAVDETSLGGWRVAWRELISHDINPYRDFASLSFAGTHDAVVYAVRDRKADSGTVRTDIIESLQKQKRIDLNEIRILNQKQYEKFPFALTTRLYPEWPFAKVKHTSDELSQKVAVALMTMAPDSQAAMSAEIAGWTIPLDYGPVHELLKELRLTPYENYGKITLGQALMQYWYLIAAGVVIILSATGTTIYVSRLNANLMNAQSEIEAARRNLEVRVDERTEELRTINEELEQEIAERGRAEQSLRESQERVSLILNSAAEGIYGLDIAGNCSFCNESALRILGYKDERELVGKNIHEMIHHTRADGTYYPIEQCVAHKVIKNGQPVHMDAEVLWRADGSSFQAEYWAYPIRKEEKVIGSVITFIDITKRVNLETQLIQAQKMESIGTLAGGVAHDFNNILSAIIGYANIALMNMPGDSAQRPYMEHILEASDRAAGLTRNLLTFSRKQMISRKPLEMNTILKDIEKLLTTMIGEDIEVNVMLHEEDLFVLGDHNQLSQVFMNLATNARDAMPKGGSLTISLDKTTLDEGFISVHGYGTPGDYALLTVTDTGDGMDEKTKQRIFEPFFTTKEVGKGTGLGMAIIYGIIKQHDGYINVYSEPGKGTTLRIYIPLAEEKAFEDKKEAEPRQPQRGTETILLAEDDEQLRKMIVSVLERFGYEVIAAVNGEEALDKFKEYRDRIHLLLFDMVMPRKSGREAYDEIRKIRPDIPVIFSSGYSSDIVFQKGLLEEGMTLIYKPVSPNELLLKVRQVLDSRNT